MATKRRRFKPKAEEEKEKRAYGKDRESRLSVRASEEDLMEIRRRAKAHGMSYSAYVRAAALGELEA